MANASIYSHTTACCRRGKKITNNIKEHTNKNTNRESDYRVHFISVSDVTPGRSVPIKDIVNIPVIPDQNVFLHCQYVRPVFLILSLFELYLLDFYPFITHLI